MISFFKYHGAGNDFIIIDDRSSFFPSRDAALIQQLCHRRFGVGADGVILLQKSLNLDEADVSMRIFNSDGREAEGCGNGTRCLMQFLADLGEPKRAYRIAVGGRILRGMFLDSGIGLEMGAMKEMRLHLRVGEIPIHFVDSGVPHAVWFVPDVDAIKLEQIGPFLRHHPLFMPRGTNVNLAARQADRSVKVRTFERGIEGETLACGTGAVAVAMIGRELFRWKSPVSICFPGGNLLVQFDDVLSDIILIGPAQKVFSGSLAASSVFNKL